MVETLRNELNSCHNTSSRTPKRPSHANELSGPEMSLDVLLEHIPLGKFHIRLLVICGAAWDLTDSQIALIASTVFIGVLVGNLFWGPFADKYGRRWAFILGCGTIIVAGFLSGLAPNYISLLAFRTLCGFGVGGSTVPFDLLAEFLPNSHRGRFLIYIEYFWTIGSMFVAGTAWLLLTSSGWRVLTFVTAIPVTVSLVGSVFVLPESPRWLLIQGRTKEAEEVMRAAAAYNGTDLPPFTLAPEKEEHHGVPIWEFLKPEQRGLSMPLWTVWLCFGFVYYGVILFVTRLFDHNSGDDGDDSESCDFNYQGIFISAASESVGVLLIAVIIDRWGRVPSQSLGYGICAVSVLLLGMKMPRTLRSLFGVLARCAVMGASCATWVATPELFKTELRATGHAVASSVARIGAFSAPFLVDSDATGFTIAVCLAAASAIATAAAMFLPETMGLDLDKVVAREHSFSESVKHLIHPVETIQARSLSRSSERSVEVSSRL